METEPVSETSYFFKKSRRWTKSKKKKKIDELYALLGYYAASSDNPLLTFRENVPVPSSRVKKFLDFLSLEHGIDRYVVLKRR
jgi:hypothetical protein